MGHPSFVIAPRSAQSFVIGSHKDARSISKVQYLGQPADLHDAQGRQLCAPSGGFAGFQRFTADDPVALESEIAKAHAQLVELREVGDQAKILDRIESLGGMLTTARREGQARSLLLLAVDAARKFGPSELLGWLLLQFATANQYLGLRTQAHQQFQEALALAESLGLERLAHFVLSHWARCLVEDGDLERARAFFTRALDMRVRLGDPRQASSRKALETLDALASGQHPSRG